MKFTIYSGFYNNIEYLNQVWEGIKNQTYTNWEWIISDDFSEDSSIEKTLIDFTSLHPQIKYIKPRWKREFYFNPPVEISTGDIMLVQDVDDFPHPKLLEVYKYNFDKFPKVEMISCSSIMKKNHIKGKIEWYRDNHYKGVYNLEEGKKMWRSLGDARAYRIKTRSTEEFAKEGEFKHSFAEDLVKGYITETKGKLLFLPRVLHTYSQESNTSVSHKVRPSEELQIMVEENSRFIEKRNSKINLEELDSIEHYYDECYDVWVGMLLSDHYNYPQNFKFDIHNSQLNPRSRNRIRELFFDYGIEYFKFREDADYAFFKVNTQEDLEYTKQNIEFYLKNNKKVTICCGVDKLKDKLCSTIGYLHWWHEWGGNRNLVFNHQFS